MQPEAGLGRLNDPAVAGACGEGHLALGDPRELDAAATRVNDRVGVSREMRTSPNSDVASIGARTSSSWITPCRVDNSSGETTDLPLIGPTALSTATRTPGGSEMRRSNSTAGIDVASAVRDANLAAKMTDRVGVALRLARHGIPDRRIVIRPGRTGPSATRRPRPALRPIGCRRSGVSPLLRAKSPTRTIASTSTVGPLPGTSSTRPARFSKRSTCPPSPGRT